MQRNKLDFLELIKSDATAALGCTEPIAVAYCAAECRRFFSEVPKKVSVITSKNIYKNGKHVYVPGSGRKGLDVACIMGLLHGNYKEKLLVLNSLTENEIRDSLKFLDENHICVSYEDFRPSIYVRVEVLAEKEVVAEIENSHTGLKKITVDGKVVFENETESCHCKLPEISLEEVLDMVDEVDVEKLDFIDQSIVLNMKAAYEGLSGDYGLGCGKSLNKIYNIDNNNCESSVKTRVLTAAAADMRMGGGNCPIITSGGSGNQGINVLIPVVVAAEENNIDDYKMKKAIFLSHAVNKYVKLFSGKLSGMCGCAIAAGVGSAAGITWMLGGSRNQILTSMKNMISDLAGMICDGAKDSCALKLSTCASESVIHSKMALNGIKVEDGVGVLGKDIEETIKNIGLLSTKAFPKVDDVVLEILAKEN